MLESYWLKSGYAQDWICLNRNSLFHQKSFKSFKPPFLNLIEMMTKHATDALFWWRCFEIHWISQRCLSYSSSDVLWIGPACVCVRVVLKKAATIQCDDWIPAGAVGCGKTWAAQRYDMWFVIHKMTTASYISCTVYICLWYTICHAQFRFDSFRFCVHNEKTFPSMRQVTLGFFCAEIQVLEKSWGCRSLCYRCAKMWHDVTVVHRLSMLGPCAKVLCWAGDLHWSQWQAGDVADCTAKDAGQAAKLPTQILRRWEDQYVSICFNMFQWLQRKHLVGRFK